MKNGMDEDPYEKIVRGNLQRLDKQKVLFCKHSTFYYTTVQSVNSPIFGWHQILDYWEVLDYSVGSCWFKSLKLCCLLNFNVLISFYVAFLANFG